MDTYVQHATAQTNRVVGVLVVVVVVNMDVDEMGFIEWGINAKHMSGEGAGRRGKKQKVASASDILVRDREKKKKSPRRDKSCVLPTESRNKLWPSEPDRTNPLFSLSVRSLTPTHEKHWAKKTKGSVPEKGGGSSAIPCNTYSVVVVLLASSVPQVLGSRKIRGGRAGRASNTGSTEAEKPDREGPVSRLLAPRQVPPHSPDMYSTQVPRCPGRQVGYRPPSGDRRGIMARYQGVDKPARKPICPRH